METCLAQWQAPPHAMVLDMDIELRAENVSGVLFVRDALITKANFSDADLERCIIDYYRAQQFELPSLNPANRYLRIPWGIRWRVGGDPAR